MFGQLLDDGACCAFGDLTMPGQWERLARALPDLVTTLANQPRRDAVLFGESPDLLLRLFLLRHAICLAHT